MDRRTTRTKYLLRITIYQYNIHELKHVYVFVSRNILLRIYGIYTDIGIKHDAFNFMYDVCVYARRYKFVGIAIFKA